MNGEITFAKKAFNLEDTMKDLPIDLKQLKYFIHVAELGSFTQAANYLDVAQPILSRQIRRLETTLGKSLLIRTGRGVTLNDSGKVLLEYSRQIMSLIDQVHDELIQGTLSGNIAIGIPPTLSRILSVPLTKKFREKLPEAKLIITESMTSTIEEKIADGRLNMGLLYNSNRSQDLDLKVLASENLYLIAPRNFPLKNYTTLSLEEASEIPLILPSYPNTFRKLIELEMTKSSLKPQVILEMNSINTIIELIVEGLGCGILSQKIIDTLNTEDQAKIKAVCMPSLKSKLYLATSNKHNITKTQKLTQEIILEVIHQYFPSNIPLEP